MSAAVKWGLITGMVYVIFSLLSTMLGLQQGGSNSGLSFVANIFIFAVTFFTVYLGIKEMRDQELSGYLTFGQGFRGGMKISLIAALISSVFAFIYLQFIDPDFGDRMMENIEAQWDKAGMQEEQREMARKFTSYMFNPIIWGAFSLAWVIFWGLVKSLIASAILKKEAPPAAPTVPPVTV
jgi:hypothetical protein